MAEMAAGGAVRIAVDIGGTFTDIALVDAGGTIHQSKVSTTPDDPSEGVLRGIGQLLDQLGIRPAAVREILHGTTVGSNAILQRKGARTGLVTTRGFRDVLEIGRIRMPEMFDLTWVKPKPLVPRRHRYEVGERIAADGSVVTPLTESDVVAAGAALTAAGLEAVAIAFINSYRNPAHERQAEQILRHHFPALLITGSSAVLPEMKEYERTSTTVVNAYLLGVMRDYLHRLDAGFRRIGIAAPLLVMTSNGGMLSADAIREKPVLAVASGPAGGVIGATRLGAARRDDDIIVFDMGGTTAKAVIIEDGRASMTSEYEFRDGISTSSRFVKAGGYMLKVPAIDIAEVGAGGGSLAQIDDGGLLVVGPHSAGALPGPACYGLGNDRPTVTDANVVLGYINDHMLAGGQLPIDRMLSEAAVDRHIARPLGVSLLDAAHGIRAVANASMARAIRAVTVERGRDPRDLTLMAFGGNGGVHAPDLARQLSIPRIVVPPLSGVFCSIGMLAADVEHTGLTTVARRLDEVSAEDLAALKAELVADVTRRLAQDGYDEGRIQLLWEADIRHEGQASELTVAFEGLSLADLAGRFAAEYLKTYGYRDLTPMELMKIRVRGCGLRDNRLDFGAMQIAPPDAPSRTGSRRVSFGRGEAAATVDIAIRSAIGETVRRGPLIIEELDATIVVPPDAFVRVDAMGCVVMELDA
jgi:N-methylhydantoinase A